MLGAIKSFIFGRPQEIDPAKHPYATATTPDQMIAAAIIQSFTKDFDDWKSYLAPLDQKMSYSSYINTATKASIENKKKQIAVRWTVKPERVGEYSYEAVIDETSVQRGDTIVILPKKEGKKIWKAYSELHRAIEKSKKVAADAKKAMEENEKKWNIAEDLLDMKRNEQGALVPKTKVEE